MIYAIQAGAFVKFGYTRKYGLKSRIASMQTGCPYELEVLACCEGDRVYESWIHLKLKKSNSHFRGEWFRLDQYAEQIIQQMLSANGLEKAVELPNMEKRSHRLGRALAFGKSILVENTNRLVPGKI